MRQKGIVQYSTFVLTKYHCDLYNSTCYKVLPPTANVLPRTFCETIFSTVSAVCPPRFHTGLFHLLSVRCVHSIYPALFLRVYILGYGTYTWAKSYDAWQNSKAAHVAGHGADH